MDLKKYETLKNKIFEFIKENEICYLLFFNGSDLNLDIQILLKKYLLIINNGVEPKIWFIDREKLYEEVLKLIGKNGNYIIQYSKTMQIDIIHIDEYFLTRYSKNIEELDDILYKKINRKNHHIIHNLRINKKELEYLIREDNTIEEDRIHYKEKLQQVKLILNSFGIN